MPKQQILELELVEYPADKHRMLTVKINTHNHKSAVHIRAPAHITHATLEVFQELFSGVSNALENIFTDKIIQELEDAMEWFRDDWNVPVTGKSVKEVDKNGD